MSTVAGQCPNRAMIAATADMPMAASTMCPAAKARRGARCTHAAVGRVRAAAVAMMFAPVLFAAPTVGAWQALTR